MKLDFANLPELLSLMAEGLLAPLYYIADPTKRIYWLFMLSSALLAICVVWLQKRKSRGRLNVFSFTKIFLSSSYWFNASSLSDVCYLFANSILRTTLLIPLFGSKVMATIIVARFLQASFDNAPELEVASWLIPLLYTLVFFIVEDFSRFGLHVLMHKIHILWVFHRVHHSATVLTPLTVHRIHPVEMALYFVRGMLVFGGVSGFFIWLFGKSLSGIDILGVGILGFLFNVLGANLRHSHIWLRFGIFEKIFISPAQHQIHHSRLPEHRDKNFGTCLAIWDRILGSCIYSGKRRYFRFGLSQAK